MSNVGSMMKSCHESGGTIAEFKLVNSLKNVKRCSVKPADRQIRADKS